MIIDPVVYEGRPSDPRTSREERCYDLLNRLGIPFNRVDHEAANTIEACREVEKILGCRICKNLFLTNRQQTDFYLLIMPGDKPFKTKLLSRQLGCARLSFAGAEQMQQYLDLTPGSVSVLGLMNDTTTAVRLIVDRDLLEDDSFGCHPCINTSSLCFSRNDLFEKFLPATGHQPTYVVLPWNPDEPDF